jgi:tetratricopeptide (TPR) repeat protein
MGEMMTATEGASHPIERNRQRVEENPESAAAHFNLGLAYTNRGVADRAERHYRKALELEPDLVEAWINLGGVLLLKWDFDGSMAANEEALKRQPDLQVAHYNIGQAFLYLGDADGVVRSYRRLIEFAPDHAGAHYFLAVGLLAAGRAADAREELTRARALGYSPAPEFLKALNVAAKELAQSRNNDTETPIKTDPRDKKKEA